MIEMQILSDEKPVEVDVDFAGEYVSGATGEEYQKGYNEGKQSEYDNFWDNFQGYGRRSCYAGAFSALSNAVSVWTEKIFKPKYSFILGASNNDVFKCANINIDFVEYLNSLGLTFDTRLCTAIGNMFHGSRFTRLGELDFTNVTRQTWAFGSVFTSMTDLVTIDKIKSDTPISGFSNLFTYCTALKNITFDCIIKGASISFLWSPLSVESMKNIILHLQNYAGTNEEFAYTVSFSANCWETLKADSTAPDGSDWEEYVFKLGWNT